MRRHAQCLARRWIWYLGVHSSQRSKLLAEHLGVAASILEERQSKTGSLISAIESLMRPEGRSLRPYAEEDLNAIEVFLADNKILDPESPDEMFESFSNRGLFRDWMRDGR